jgi:hypothetical protein
MVNFVSAALGGVLNYSTLLPSASFEDSRVFAIEMVSSVPVALNCVLK